MPRALVLAVSLVLALTGCSGAEDDRPTVLAGFYPLAWAVEQVAGDAFRIVDLTPAGAEPHDLELTPRDVGAVRDAHLVLYVGGGFQPSLEDAVAERDGPALDVLNERDRDPHVWLDPVRFARIVSAVAAALGREASAAEPASALRGLDEEFRRGLASCERRELVTTHAAFGRLADRYGLRQVALGGLAPESEPAARDLEGLIERVERTRATTVFAEPLLSSDLAETVAREAAATVAVLDPLEGLSQDRLDTGADYLSVMRENLAALRKGLGCR